MITRSTSYVAVPPGATIKEQIDSRKMHQNELAERLGMSQKHLSNLINGKTLLTHEVALKLETVIGIPASFWINLESRYREQLKRVEQEKSDENEREFAKKVPYVDCANKGWVPPTRKIEEKVVNLRRFFKVTNLSIVLNTKTEAISFRRLTEISNNETDYKALMWIQRAKNLADEIDIENELNIKKLKDNLESIRSMTLLPPHSFFEELVDLLNNCGIILIMMPTLKSSFIHGATFKYRRKIVMPLTIRRKDADIFWFSLFHELGHIILGHIDEEMTIDDDEETAANEFARNILIPKNVYQEFLSLGNFSEKAIKDFARNINISPGIVVGRMQTDHYLNFNQLRHLKERYELSEN